MASKFKYQLTKRAEADLDEIISYIAVELSNPQAASSFMDKLEREIDEACSFPESGSAVVNEFLPNIDVRKKLVGNYIMYYFPEYLKKTIYIIRIVYCKRNMDELWKEKVPGEKQK